MTRLLATALAHLIDNAVHLTQVEQTENCSNSYCLFYDNNGTEA